MVLSTTGLITNIIIGLILIFIIPLIVRAQFKFLDKKWTEGGFPKNRPRNFFNKYIEFILSKKVLQIIGILLIIIVIVVFISQ